MSVGTVVASDYRNADILFAAKEGDRLFVNKRTSELMTLQCAPESDATLIDRAVGGDEWAYQVLFRRHRDRVRALVHRCASNVDEAEDLVQLVFIKTFLGLPGFRGQAAFTTWLTRIAMNVCTNYLRSLNKRRVWLSEVKDAVPALQARWRASPDEGPEAVMARRERRRTVIECIRALPERQREAVSLHYLMERSYDEIVEQLQVPMGTLKVWLYRGRHGLRREVERLGMTGSSLPH